MPLAFLEITEILLLKAIRILAYRIGAGRAFSSRPCDGIAGGSSTIARSKWRSDHRERTRATGAEVVRTGKFSRHFSRQKTAIFVHFGAI